MKWNWGKGLVVGMACFMTFILYLVITMSTDSKYSHDLVTEDYYAKEMAYQNEIDDESNLKSLSQPISGEKTAEGWLISFPEEINETNSKGKVFLYRPSNKQLDFETTISLSKSHLLIPDSRLVDGRWNIKVDWQYNGKSYLYKKEIIY